MCIILRLCSCNFLEGGPTVSQLWEQFLLASYWPSECSAPGDPLEALHSHSPSHRHPPSDSNTRSYSVVQFRSPLLLNVSPDSTGWVRHPLAPSSPCGHCQHITEGLGLSAPLMSPSRGLLCAGLWEGRKRGRSWFVLVKQEVLPGK